MEVFGYIGKYKEYWEITGNKGYTQGSILENWGTGKNENYLAILDYTEKYQESGMKIFLFWDLLEYLGELLVNIGK